MGLEWRIRSQSSTYSPGAAHRAGRSSRHASAPVCCRRVVLPLPRGDVATRVDLHVPDTGPTAACWLWALLRAGVLRSNLRDVMGRESCSSGEVARYQ